MATYHNIEPLARALCEKAMRRFEGEKDLAAWVERLWHAYAAQLTAGFMDEDGNVIAHSLEEGLDAYRQWRLDHPEYRPPPPPAA